MNFHHKITMILLAFSVSTFSQSLSHSVLATDGGFSTHPSGSIGWTIGEPISETFKSTSNISTVGFHQPEIIDLPTLIDKNGITNEIIVYPNPVFEKVTVKLGEFANSDLTVMLIDALGKIVYHTKLNPSSQTKEITIQLNECASGNYFIQLSKKEITKTVKINKLN